MALTAGASFGSVADIEAHEAPVRFAFTAAGMSALCQKRTFKINSCRLTDAIEKRRKSGCGCCARPFASLLTLQKITMGGRIAQKQKASAAPVLTEALSLGNAKGFLCTQ